MKILLSMPDDIYFSNNGLDPSSFRKSTVIQMRHYDNKNFLNCDFRGAFIFDRVEDLIKMGAVVDEM